MFGIIVFFFKEKVGGFLYDWLLLYFGFYGVCVLYEIILFCMKFEIIDKIIRLL